MKDGFCFSVFPMPPFLSCRIASARARQNRSKKFYRACNNCKIGTIFVAVTGAQRKEKIPPGRNDRSGKSIISFNLSQPKTSLW